MRVRSALQAREDPGPERLSREPGRETETSTGSVPFAYRLRRRNPFFPRKVSATVKVTIDSSEPLDQALRVLGAMYDVTLRISSTDTNEPNGSQHSSSDGDLFSPRKPGRKGRPGRSASAARRKSSTGGKRAARVRVSTAELRSWARENGYTVAERGRLPKEIAAAYNAAKKV